MKKDELMPDFLIIGAGKAGTTSLDHYLKQHPQIFMSGKKEPSYFAYLNYTIHTIPRDQLKYYNGSVRSLQDYLKLFELAKPGQIKGEVSPAYLKEPGAPHAIKANIPDVKLIAILRQPVERLYSRYLHLARENQLPTKDFKDVLNKNNIWSKRDDLIPEGFYHKHLSTYYELFPRQQIMVLLYEDYKQYPQDTLEKLFGFLNVDSNLTLDISVKYNKSGFIKSKSYDRLLGHNSILKTFTKEYIPDVYKNLKRSQWMQNMVNSIKDKNLVRPKLSPELKKTITEKIYLEDIKKLQDLINRDLSSWIKY